MIALDPSTTALMLIDLQNGILGRKLEPISAEELVERRNALAGKFRAAGALVVLFNAAPGVDEPPRRVDEPSTLPKTAPGRQRRAGFLRLLIMQCRASL
jgi:nicotinamidase-related amidase